MSTIDYAMDNKGGYLYKMAYDFIEYNHLNALLNNFRWHEVYSSGTVQTVTAAGKPLSTLMFQKIKNVKKLREAVYD